MMGDVVVLLCCVGLCGDVAWERKYKMLYRHWVLIVRSSLKIKYSSFVCRVLRFVLAD